MYLHLTDASGLRQTKHNLGAFLAADIMQICIDFVMFFSFFFVWFPSFGLSISMLEPPCLVSVFVYLFN